MKKAHYHQEDKEPLLLDVLKHKDGMVDLGRGDEPVVTNCVVLDAPKPGFATLVGDAEAKEPAKEKAAKSK